MADVLAIGDEIRLATPNSNKVYKIRELELKDSSRLRVELDDVHGRDSAAALVGASVFVDRNTLPALDSDSHYDVDLVGCLVVDTEQIELGRLVEVIPTGANDVYVIDGPKGEWLVPARRDVVIEVDLDTKRIVVTRDGLVYPDDP